MKLIDLLAELTAEQLDRIVAEHIRADEQTSRATLCSMLESTLKSYRFVQDFVLNRQPPTFAILDHLLEAPGFSVPADGFRERVMAETTQLAELVAKGEVVGRDRSLRTYRRVLHTARQNDLQIDSSESSILAVLRAELSIAHVEHFLIEHHPDLQEFWSKDHCFLHELNALRSAGLVFARGGNTLLADDVAPLVRQALGIDMPSANTRRLCELLANSELVEVLEAHHAPTSGTKEEKIDRLITHRIQARFVLRNLSLASLREICRQAGAVTSGSKDDLVERIVEHFTAGLDQVVPVAAPVVEPVREERALDEQRFRLLFGQLRGNELGGILSAFPELRQSGAKDARCMTLWEALRSEVTLLSVLMNRDLEAILYRFDLKLAGSKRERIDRIIQHFAMVDPAQVTQNVHQDEQTLTTESQSLPVDPVAAKAGGSG